MDSDIISKKTYFVFNYLLFKEIYLKDNACIQHVNSFL